MEAVDGSLTLSSLVFFVNWSVVEVVSASATAFFDFFLAGAFFGFITAFKASASSPSSSSKRVSTESSAATPAAFEGPAVEANVFDAGGLGEQCRRASGKPSWCKLAADRRRNVKDAHNL